MESIKGNFVTIKNIKNLSKILSSKRPNSITIIPFSSVSAVYLDRIFFEILFTIKKLNKGVAIFCFYAYIGGIKTTACILFRGKKTLNIIGEAFSHKRCSFAFCNKIFDITLFPYVFDKDYSPKSDYILFFDDEKMQNKKYLKSKFSSKILFFDK